MIRPTSSTGTFRFWKVPAGRPASANSRVILRAQPWTFGECFSSSVLPARSAEAAQRNTCQTGKFHGRIDSTVPSGWYASQALRGAMSTGRSSSQPGPSPAMKSQLPADFSTSARASAMGLPISSVISRAMASFRSRSSAPTLLMHAARSATAVEAHTRAEPAACASAASTASTSSNGHSASSSPVAGLMLRGRPAEAVAVVIDTP